jgi:hypothetical protein
VNAAADSAQAHAGNHGEYMIPDEAKSRANPGRRAKTTGRRNEEDDRPTSRARRGLAKPRGYKKKQPQKHSP